jgi:hypothetical protein
MSVDHFQPGCAVSFMTLWPPTFTISTLALLGVITSSAAVAKSFASTDAILILLKLLGIGKTLSILLNV